jgi:hypothetical protein
MGFDCAAVEIRWSARKVAEVGTADGFFAYDLRVPEEATGRHVVSARCAQDHAIKDGAVFRVVPTVTRPSLVLDPTLGPAGTKVRLIGRDYPGTCRNLVFRIHGAPVEPREPRLVRDLTTGRHRIEFEFEVPEHAALGANEVELSCEASAKAVFTVPRIWPRSLLAASISAPSDVSMSLERVLGSLFITALIMLLIGFPAEIFNKAYENSRELGERIPALRRLRESLAKIPGAVQFCLFSVLTVGLLTLAGPAEDRKPVTAFGLLVAVVLTSLTFGALIEVFIRWFTGRRGTVRVLPGALLIAFSCAFVSTELNLRPGYVYGLILTFVLVTGGKEVDRGTRSQKGRAVLVASVATLTVSFAAWLAWIPINDAADHGSTHMPTLVADAVLSAVFLMGVQTVLFGLIPLTFLDGYLLSRWSRPIWLLCAAASVFAFVHIVYGEQSAKVMQSDWHTVGEMFALFLIVAVLSLAFWTFVRLRRGIRRA